MIYITGDVHIPTQDIQKLNTKRFPEQKQMSKDDYVIICGDFGGVWDASREEQYWVNWLSSKNFTTLFIDGNHENFDLLGECEIVRFNGGKAHKIAENVYHLMRGYIFELDGKRIFTLGGAQSHDKEYRTEGRNWWNEEMPSDSEYAKAKTNLMLCGNRVDIVLTHCAPSSVQKLIAPEYAVDKLTDFLDDLKAWISYDKWYFGHYHIDKEIDEKHIALFNKIIGL